MLVPCFLAGSIVYEIVGTQATLNVLVGGRWKIVPKEVRSYFLGQYGKPPAELDPVIQKKVIGDETPITCRPAENIAPELEAAAKAVARREPRIGGWRAVGLPGGETTVGGGRSRAAASPSRE